MLQYIELRLRDHREQLSHLEGCVKQELAKHPTDRTGATMRFLHHRISMHRLVIDELSGVLAEARRKTE